MAKHYRFDFSTDHAEDADDDNRQTVSLAAMAITLFLLVVALFLVRQLHHKSHVEDCLLSGNTRCDFVLDKTR